MQKLLNYLKDYNNFYSCVVPVNFIFVPLLLASYSYFFTINSFLELMLIVPIPNILLLGIFYSFKVIENRKLIYTIKVVNSKPIDYSKYSNVVPFKRSGTNESKVG